jgi:hypothetical protein
VGRTIFKYLAINFLAIISINLYGFQPVHDVQNYLLLSKLMTNHLKQFEELKGVNEILKKVDISLGENAVLDASVYAPFTNWLNYRLAVNDDNTHALQSIVNEGSNINWGSYASLQDEIKSKLFYNRNESIDFDYYNRTQNNRKTVFESATKSGLALSGYKEITLKASQKLIQILGKKAIESKSTHEDLKIMNQILTVISTEIIQLEEVQLKQLELIAMISMVISEESVFKIEPLKQYKSGR